MTAATTLPLPLLLCRMKLTLTDDPEVKVVAGIPAPFSVCALLAIAAVLRVNGVVTPTDRYAVPTLLLVSAAVTVTFPLTPAGTVRYPMNDPSEAAASVAGTGRTICPPIMKTIGELTLNPVPMTCTVLPTLTLAGVKVIVGMTKVNDAVATFPDASVTVKVFVAAAVSGIANVAESPPVLLVVDELKVIAAPLTFAVTALSAANPVAVAVMVVPLLPVLGVTSIDGPTVIAVWTIRPVFESVMVSR